MGCASSNPLVEGGKNMMDNAKETKDIVVARGEKAIHDAGDAVSTGVEHVKNAVGTGFATAQSGIGSVVHSIENTIGTAKTNVEEKMEDVDSSVEDMTHRASDAMDEAISDTKTVLAFEDATTDVLAEKEDALKHEFGESVKEMDKTMEETLHIEDIEQAIDSVLDSPTIKIKSPEKDVKTEEEPPLTPWEAAADEILERSVLKSSIDSQEVIELDTEKENESDQIVTDVSKSENFDKDYTDILLSDTLSMKSYKSEI